MSMQSGGGTSPFSAFDGQFFENPFPAFAQMRTFGAVVPAPFGGNGINKAWLVTRMDEAVKVLKDSKRFTVDRSNIDAGRFSRGPEREGTFFGQSSLLSLDEPAHRRLRGLVSKAFTPKYIQGLRPSIQRIADDLIDRVEKQGSMDLVNDYAYPLPINVISDILGVPTDQREQLRDWSEAISNGSSSDGNPQERWSKIQAFTRYVVQLVAEKRQQPADDLVSQLVQMEQEGDHLNENELLALVGLLIFAGHETTSNLIGIGTLTLLDHPEQLEKLKADPQLVPSAVEELLRVNGSVVFPVPRFATEEVELAGQHISRGDLLLVVLGSANHDEHQFTDSEDLDIARSLNRHIAFGYGIHVCLGAPLARLEGDIAFTTLFRRLPHLRLAVPHESIIWRGNLNLRGILSLPLTF